MEIKDFRSRFGYHTTPFTREIPVTDMMRLPEMDQAVAALERVVDNRMSGALIAPAGTGKTAVLRVLQARLPEARYRTHYVKVTDLNKRDMCREIASVAGAVSAGSYPGLVRNLQQHYLNCLETDGLRPVLLVDEGHDLRPDVLAMLRLLTNFDMLCAAAHNMSCAEFTVVRSPWAGGLSGGRGPPGWELPCSA